MSNRFFDKFPIVNYNGVNLRNIILRSKIIKEVLDNIDVMHPFTIEDGERPDTIAFDYYGDSELYWLIFLSNNIEDPYYDWPLNQSEFKNYVIKKYGTIEQAKQKIIYWSNPNFDYYMTPETKSLLSGDDIIGWNTPIYAYDYEDEINENKRFITLIDKSYVQQIITEINRIYV